MRSHPRMLKVRSHLTCHRLNPRGDPWSNQVIPRANFAQELVGGFNPSEKYQSKVDHFPKLRGETGKIFQTTTDRTKNHYLFVHPKINSFPTKWHESPWASAFPPRWKWLVSRSAQPLDDDFYNPKQRGETTAAAATTTTTTPYDTIPRHTTPIINLFVISSFEISFGRPSFRFQLCINIWFNTLWTHVPKSLSPCELHSISHSETLWISCVKGVLRKKPPKRHWKNSNCVTCMFLGVYISK